MPVKTLSHLATALEVVAASGCLDTPVTGLTYDSRKVEPGFIFVAVPGYKYDGHDFIPQALARGAVGIISQKEASLPPGVGWLHVRDSRLALGLAAAAYYDYPARSLRVIGVTGTNGKTTTTHLIHAALNQAGISAGLLGTLGLYLCGQYREMSRTTPEAPDIQAAMAQMRAAGCRAVVMEVSSHALELHRVAGIEFDVAVFTNLTQDHLDFHGNVEAYRQAKGRLFAALGSGAKVGPKYAVVNADDPAGEYFCLVSAAPAITYGVQQEAAVRGRKITYGSAGVSLTVTYPAGEQPLALHLSGLFNVYNALAAWAVAWQEGIPPVTVARALQSVTGIPGRFEAIRSGQDFQVIVDYAHTPDGLENVLRAARQVTAGRVITVFGCGGDRDRGKRPLMGEIAGRDSDFVIVTADNPRSENALDIIREIEPGLRQSGRQYTVVPDRRLAIYQALGMAGPGDLVLIAGKGHETYQIVGDEVLPFDDRLVARQALESMGYGSQTD
ncbi:MAG: UDP-N-acetylmuramoyl-L-alanyl-D-glutamate--2,6-diaminopimelate ligase [Clostridia bacterium]|nr:MAG: UDP-N-acetylmuramoyl-L-alanyl-D-glutamate--2,6-diaminopimelate ligase [Clostridia bacterium]